MERHAEGGEGLLNAICRYLDLFTPHIRPPGPIAAYSFSSTRGSTIANRVARLAQAIADAFSRLGTDTRYLLRIADHFFQIHHKGDHYAWGLIGELSDLEDHLAEPTPQFLPTRIDRLSMQNSPLPALITRNEPGLIQVFYRIHDSGIQLYIFDEQGAVFQQRVADADEYRLLIQQQRFLDSVATRRILHTGDSAPNPGPRFARVGRLPSGEWQVKAIKVPSTRVTDHIELVLAVSPGGRLQEGFRLQLGQHEFDSLMLGEDLYQEVARHLHSLRRKGSKPYPVYLTGVISAEGDPSGPCSLVELLRLKQQLEQRLADAMR